MDAVETVIRSLLRKLFELPEDGFGDALEDVVQEVGCRDSLVLWEESLVDGKRRLVRWCSRPHEDTCCWGKCTVEAGSGASGRFICGDHATRVARRLERLCAESYPGADLAGRACPREERARRSLHLQQSLESLVAYLANLGVDRAGQRMVWANVLGHVRVLHSLFDCGDPAWLVNERLMVCLELELLRAADADDATMRVGKLVDGLWTDVLTSVGATCIGEAWGAVMAVGSLVAGTAAAALAGLASWRFLSRSVPACPPLVRGAASLIAAGVLGTGLATATYGCAFALSRKAGTDRVASASAGGGRARKVAGLFVVSTSVAVTGLSVSLMALTSVVWWYSVAVPSGGAEQVGLHARRVLEL